MASDGKPATNRVSVDEPLEFDSYLRSQIWGGDALGRDFGKSPSGHERIGESWELSGLAEHPSIVSKGTFAGQSVADLWTTQAQDLAGPGHCLPVFPIFVKWLNCHEFLSIQVHPDDALACELSGEPCGKSEAWVVVRAEPTARVYAGLRPGVSRDQLLSHLADGTVADCLHSFAPKVGDCISLPAGTLHSAGGGIVVAEIQQPSDTTFRLFDWNRQGLDGQPRPLHVDMALKSIDWTQGPVTPAIPLALACPQNVEGERLLKTSAFELERFTLRGSWQQPYSGEMAVWMIRDGAAVLTWAGSSNHRVLNRGSTVLIPAAVRDAIWSVADTGNSCQMLCIRRPETAVQTGDR